VRILLSQEEKLKRKHESSNRSHQKHKLKLLEESLGIFHPIPKDGYKFCKDCKGEFLISDFYKNNKGRPIARCRKCHILKTGEWHKNHPNPEMDRVNAAKWRADNPVKAKEISKRASEKRKQLVISEEEKELRKKADREYYHKNREIMLARHREYYQKNKEKVKESIERWRKANPDKIKEIRKGVSKRRRAKPEIAKRMSESKKEWYLNNIEHAQEYARKYWIENKEAITERMREKKKEYAKKNVIKINQIKKKSRNKRMQEDPAVKLKIRVSTAIYQCLKAKKGNRSILEILPYSIKDLMAHLESQFVNGMTWENYGEWHVDHIKPRVAFNYNSATDPDFLKLWALDNLQPLWAIDNYRKGHKII
jgi:hypothetical protein